MFDGALREDHSAVANLPQEVVYKEYPKCDFLRDGNMDDSIRGLDDDNRSNIDQVNRRRSNVKY